MSQTQSQKPEWAQQFKIDDDTWTTLCSQAARQKNTPLDVALDSGLLNENKLIAWDRNLSGLASLNTLFFNGEPPIHLWEKLDYHWCRAQACLPIGEWDGHVYWAKLSSEHIEFPVPTPNVIWVIAPWTGVKKWFSQWETNQLEAPQALKIDTGAILPAGLAEFKMPDANAVDAPVGLSMSTPQIVSLTLAPTPPPAPAVAQAAPIHIPPTPQPVMPPATPIAPVAISVSTNIANLPIEQLAGRLKITSNQEELAATLMGSWQNYFTKVMILLYQGNKLIIWRWNAGWKGQIKVGDTITLDTPSIFKIVADTGTLYHGYVVAGPVNDRFFHQTDGGQYPDHVTVAPVIAQGKVVAMLVGTCTKDVGRSLILGRLEEHAGLFSTALMRLLNPVQKVS
ncbi:MAG: hypothetical protein SGI74_13510 [Oligoflexia bacterium]|nr:hypothetical protein [Oligoflexia bacterium]